MNRFDKSSRINVEICQMLSSFIQKGSFTFESNLEAVLDNKLLHKDQPTPLVVENYPPFASLLETFEDIKDREIK